MSASRRLLWAGVMGMWVAASGAGLARGQEQTLKQLQDQARRQQATRLEQQGLKLAPGQLRMQDVCGLRLVEGRLALEVKRLPPLQSRPARLRIQGIEEDVVITPYGGAGQGWLQLVTTRFSDPQAFAVETQLTSMPDQLSIRRTEQFADGSSMVQFVQSSIRRDIARMGGVLRMPAEAVMLRVVERRSNGRDPVVINLTGPDFRSLRQSHWQEVNRYLRPALRELKLDGAFAADATVAWQVFAERWPGEPAAREQVMKLLPELDAESRQERDAAVEKLRSGGQGVALAILHMDRTGLSAEQNARLDMVLAPFQVLPAAQAAKLKEDPEFLLDCLYLRDEPVATAALDALRQVTRREIAVDLTADPAQRAGAIEPLREELCRRPATRAAE